jgi:hypothetical protein
MSHWENWVRRHLADDPMEPASPQQPSAAQRAEDFEPYTGQGEIPAVQEWIQRARELQHEAAPKDAPIYDQVVADALAVDGFAATVERDLKALTERNAS